MTAYKILFYKRRRDWLPSATYYREFATWLELQNWCKDMVNTCKYYRFFDERISSEAFLKATQNQTA